VGPCELSVFEEQQDYHARLIVDARPLQTGEIISARFEGAAPHHVGTCTQEHQVCIGFFDGLKTSAAHHVDRP